MQKKKLLLLSAIVLLMGMESYGKTFEPGEHTVSEDITVTTGSGHQLNAGKEGQLTKVTNTGNIIVNGGTGINLYYDTKPTGWRKGNNHFINDGVITVNKGKGIQITTNGTVENNKEMVVNGGASGAVVNGDNASFINNETGTIVVTGTNSKGIDISKGTAANNGTVEAKDGAIGIYVNGGGIHNSGTIVASGVNTDGVRIESGTFTTDKNSMIEVKGSDKLTSGKSEASGVKVNGNSNFVNNGIIKVTGTNDGTYSGYQSKGINVNSATASATNEGTIIVDRNGIGAATKGTFINNNGIKVSGSGIGINVIDSGNTTNTGIIEADGKSYGIQVSAKGTATNKGIIVVKNGSTGMTTAKVTGNTTSYTDVINDGTIQVTGDSSTGMQANDNRKVTNNSDILVEAGNFTSGMKAYGTNALAENNGNLTIVGNGVNTSNGMIAQNGGRVVNGKDGTVTASGKTTSAMSASGKNSSAENNGTIELDSNAIGMKIEKDGIGTNNKTIKGNGIGVKLNGGIFVNNGTIDTTGNAIESSAGTNNTVYLKNGSNINGKIAGNTGVDVLALEGNKDGQTGEYSNLDVSKYEAISVRNGDTIISDSTIALEYNKGTKDYLETSKNELNKIESSSSLKADSSGNLTMKNSSLIIDFKDSLTNPDATENPIIDVGTDGKLTFDGNTNFVFNSSDGRTEFDVNEALGIENIDTDNMKLDTTAVWDYDIVDGKITAKKQAYTDVITKSQLGDFVNVLEESRSSLDGEFFEGLAQLELLQTADEFTKAMAQMSGGLHGYTVDIAAINSRNLVNTIKNRALTRDYLTARPVNSWYQDVVYLDNNQRLGGLMSGSYQESGVLGISEKQAFSNGRLGFVYGGSKGEAKFDGGDSGEIKNDNIYVGLYYNHDFSDNFALNTNFSFVYGHNNVKRNVKFGTTDYTFDSTYPTYAMGVGTSAIYTIKDDAKNKASFYAGIDVNRIMQGNINEEGDKKDGEANELAIKNVPVDENSYYSITPSAGFMVQNTGYIWDRKYLVGADLAWETELGNIKDGKRLSMQKNTGALARGYKVGTMERENLFSTSIFGQLDITESLALNGKYTSVISDEYDADMVTLGMTYKMDTMADNIVFGPILSGLENLRPSSDRWGGTFALMMEAEDDSDRAYYDSNGELTGGDYATSMQMKPKFTLSLRDKKTKWSYYFEGYYKANDFIKDTKANENQQDATRLHGEARWNDSYSKGNYGMAFGYRNETSNKPLLSTYPEPQRVERGVHQLRLTPNFSYNLGNGFALNFKTTGIFEYNYTGLRDGQMDFLMENEHALVYTGFMPRWNLKLGYYREDRWLDHDSNKLSWNTKAKKLEEVSGARRYQQNQLRPSATYYLGNGDSVTFALRIPLGNGAWYNELGTDKKASESYETRYSIDYNHLVVPGFTVFGGVTFLDIKSKNTDSSNANFGKVTRSYSFRPKLGFSYSF